jgi:hypothetical protein
VLVRRRDGPQITPLADLKEAEAAAASFFFSPLRPVQLNAPNARYLVGCDLARERAAWIVAQPAQLAGIGGAVSSSAATSSTAPWYVVSESEAKETR